VATEVRPPRPSDTYWPTKYELLTTAVRKLLTSVQFRSDPAGVHSKDLASTHPFTIYELPATTRWKSVIRRTPFENFGPTPSATCWGRGFLPPPNEYQPPTTSCSKVLNHARISVLFGPTRCLLKRPCPTPPTCQI
jgi:hypothetical protein